MTSDKFSVKIDNNNDCIKFMPKRCINCGMCKKICENVVGIDSDKNHTCINCGQCLKYCPTGALLPKLNYTDVLKVIDDSSKVVAISIAPSVIVTLKEEFGLTKMNFNKTLPSILKSMGFDYVFDGSFGIDVNIMETSLELKKRLDESKLEPLYSGFCLSWTKYASVFHPELMGYLSDVKNPYEIQSTIIKTYFKKTLNIKKDIISVIVTPCTALKTKSKNTDIDYVITTQELAKMIREKNVNFSKFNESNCEDMLARGSKDAFNAELSGKWTMAILNTLYYLVNKKYAPKDYFSIVPQEPITITSYLIKDKIISVAIVNGLKNLDKFIKSGEYADLIEVTNCPDGCINGGGEPLVDIKKLKQTREKRMDTYNQTTNDVLHSVQNDEISNLYNYLVLNKNKEKVLYNK